MQRNRAETKRNETLWEGRGRNKTTQNETDGTETDPAGNETEFHEPAQPRNETKHNSWKRNDICANRNAIPRNGLQWTRTETT